MIKAIVIGASYGGMEAIKAIFRNLPKDLNVPVLIVLHIGNNKVDTFLNLLNKGSEFKIREADELETIKPNTVYFAPPNYHLQVENEKTISLSADAKVNFSRPSIDVLFETAAWVFKDELLGILLTGSNSDGANGLKTIKKYGGITMVENPETAKAKIMPMTAINLTGPDYILDLENMASKIYEVVKS